MIVTIVEVLIAESAPDGGCVPPGHQVSQPLSPVMPFSLSEHNMPEPPAGLR